jgi:hypothetical protein
LGGLWWLIAFEMSELAENARRDDEEWIERVNHAAQ